jgi:nitrite reductase (NO-forming)
MSARGCAATDKMAGERFMWVWENARAKLREWYIVVIGLCLIAGGFFLASHQPSPSAALSVMAQVGKPPPGSQMAAPAPQPAPPATSATAKQTSSPPAPVASANVREPAAQPSPPPAHEHSMTHTTAAADMQTSAQAQPAAGAPPTAGGDPGAGRLVFRKCQACHSMETGKTILNPSLAGIIGRKAGAEAGYNYSPAMKQANIVWDAKTLGAYLSDPQKVVPGNTMPFPGLKTDHDRADVIAFFAASAAGAQAAPSGPPAAATAQQAPAATNQAPQAAPAQASPPAPVADTSYISSDAKYTLRSGIAEGRMVYIGVGGSIDGKCRAAILSSTKDMFALIAHNNAAMACAKAKFGSRAMASRR